MGILGFGKKSPPQAPAKAAPAKAAPAKAAPAKAAPAKSSGGGAGGELRSAAVCGDGISVANFERMSYEQWEKQAGNQGKTIQQWRDAVVEALKGASEGDASYEGPNVTQAQADRFHDVAALLGGEKGQPKYTSATQLENLLEAKVPGFEAYGNFDPQKAISNPKSGGFTNFYPTYRQPMWRYLKQKGLADQAHWQHETTASWINKGGKKFYADPTEIPYLVSDVAPVGTFVKISTPDGTRSTYARVLEAGTQKAEASLKVWRNLGYPNTTAASAPLSKLNVEVFEGTGGLGKRVKDGAFSYENTYFNNDEIQRAGAILDRQKKAGQPLPPMQTRQDLQNAEGTAQPPKQASADPAAAPAGGGGYRLEKGFPTVAIGKNMRLVGYACQDCIHDGGGYVMEGSATVYVGKYPFARIDDPTSDELAVLTGDETVFVGGPPTSATLA